MRLHTAFADVSNLDKENRKLERDDRRRMASLGNRLWHSDATFRIVPRTLFAAERPHRDDATAATPRFADMRRGLRRARRHATKAEIEDLVCEHSLIYSRGQLGFSNFTDEERHSMRPVLLQARAHAPCDRDGSRCCCRRHIGAIVGWPRPEAMAFIRDLMEHATRPAIRLRPSLDEA